jgi:hypothetical protein
MAVKFHAPIALALSFAGAIQKQQPVELQADESI